MVNIKKILVPTDLSSFSSHAVEYASTFCKLFNAELYLLYVVNKIPYKTIPTLTVEMKKMYEAEIETAGTKIDNQIKLYIKNCPSVIKKFSWGDPEQEIVAFAEKNKIDLIVMSAHTKPVTGEPESGSITDKISNRTKIPVMMIRPGTESQTDSPESGIESSLSFSNAQNK